MSLIGRCTCGNGEAEEDRGAVLRCPIHGFEARTQEALRVAAEAAPCPNCAGAVDALHEALDAARTFNRGGMTWLEYDALLVRLASQHPRGQ
jgi:tRNA U54 and U55 pseudouridine synthase Pus10